MPELLNDELKKQIKEIFTQLLEPVELLYFGQSQDCDYCDDTLQLVQEVTALSDRLGFIAYDLKADAETARLYNIDKAPGLVIAGRDGDRIIDYGVRISGIPAGHEFTSFIQDLILVSGRDSKLNQATRDLLAKLTEPILLQVFVTPT